MEALYTAAAAGDVPDRETREALWNKWLWGLDCNEAVSEKLGDMNACHMTGLLIACIESSISSGAQQGPAQEEGGGGSGNDTAGKTRISELLPRSPLVHLFSKPVEEYSLRELADQTECLQLSWGHILSNAEQAAVMTVFRAVLGRLGHLAQHAYEDGAGTLDDPQHITPLPLLAGPKELMIVTRKFLRQMCCTLLVMARVLHIVSAAEVVPELSQAEREGIVSILQVHHIQASMDTFSMLQQMAILAPGQRLVYRTNFAGMYNDVSQVRM